MSGTFKHIAPGDFPGSVEYNRLVDAVDSILRSSHVQYFTDSRGVHVRPSPPGPLPLRRAFVKSTPGAVTAVDVFLDVDTTGQEVEVECYIYGGGNLNAAFPTLVDGMPLYVQFDVATGKWKNVTSLYKIGADCSA